MEGVIEKDKYLDLNGLKRYDELIKSYIELGHKSLANASDVSALLIDVAALKSIDHDAYISADEKLETAIKGYIDTKMDSKQDIIEDLATIRSGAAAGAAAQDLASAKEYADSLASNYDAAGAAAQALADAKSYVDGKGYLTENDLVFATNDDVDALFA